MKNLPKTRLTQITVTFIAVIIILIALVYTTIVPSLRQSLTIVLGSFFVLVLPGLTLTYVFYPNSSLLNDDNSEKISKNDFIERATLAILLSIALMPTALFIAHKSGVVLTTTNVTILVVSVNIMTGLMIFATFKLKSK